MDIDSAICLRKQQSQNTWRQNPSPLTASIQNNIAVPSDRYVCNRRPLARTVIESQSSDIPETRMIGGLIFQANPQSNPWKAIHPSFLMYFEEQNGWHSQIMFLNTDLQSSQPLQCSCPPSFSGPSTFYSGQVGFSAQNTLHPLLPLYKS